MSHSPFLSQDQVIVFEGDSLTRRSMGPSADNWPFLRMNNWHHSYAEILEEWLFANLPHLRIKCRHAAIGGSTTEELLARYEKHVKPHRPSWIILTIGTNDYSRGIPLEQFSNSLKSYILQAQKDSGARFLYAGGFEIMPGLPDGDKPRITAAQTYYHTARAIIREHGGLAPEIGRALREKAETHYASSTYHSYYSDGSHLNALGNHALAGLLLQALGAYSLLPDIS